MDDEQTNLLYSSLIIKKNFKDKQIISFKDPFKAVEYFEHAFSSDPSVSVVLLDINMPGLSGWYVLDRLQMMPKEIKEKLAVLMVSSSINWADKIRSSEYSLVNGYIEKPLTIGKLKDAVAFVLR